MSCPVYPGFFYGESLMSQNCEEPVLLCIKSGADYSHAVHVGEDATTSTWKSQIRSEPKPTGTLVGEFTIVTGDFIDDKNVTHTNEGVFLVLTNAASGAIPPGTYYSDLRQDKAGFIDYFVDFVIKVTHSKTQP